ncbi:hypothetical protein ACHAXT_002822 [Thalassiosira profunda]
MAPSAVSTRPPSRTASEPLAKAAAAPRRSGSDPGSSAATDDGGVTFHKSDEYKFGAVYWRHGFPENGRMVLRGRTLAFKGIVGKRLSFELDAVDIASASRMGGLVHDAFVIAPKGGNGDEGEKYLFSTVLKHRKKVLEKIQTANEEGGAPEGKATKQKKAKFRMPPDETLRKMDTIAQRKLRGVSLQDYYEVAWSEGHACDKPAMYGPFLEQQGKDNVHVGEWKSGEFEGEWCGETYAHERVVTFEFMKQTIGQTLVQVKHTQRCRRAGNDRLVVHIKMEMKGFPYADCFVVQVRHVASRMGNEDLSIQIGMSVQFLKSCLFEKKIKNNTGAETSKAQLTLLDMTLKGCSPYAKEVADATEESEEEEGAIVAASPRAGGPAKLPEPVVKVLRFILVAAVAVFRNYLQPCLPTELFDFSPYTVEEALQSVQARVRALEELCLKATSTQQKKEVISREIDAIEKSIARIKKAHDLKEE